jgi:type II secretory pathway component GspD/PulD (secretin)
MSSFVMQSDHVYASELEDLSTPETIGTQLVNKDTAAIPYVITGESLVSVIANMVDFDINGAMITFNRPTGQLVVKNTPDNLSKVEEILFEMRRSISRQIAIEARIITVSSDDIDAFGLQSFLGSQSYSMTADDKGSVDIDNITSYPDVMDRDNTNYYGQEFVFGVLDKSFSIGLAIDALKSNYEVNTLSSPRLTVFNNQRAHVKVATITDYVSEVDAEIEASSDNLYYTVDTKVRQAPSGTILDVTPTINNDGTITLALHPTFVTADLDTTVDIESVASGESGGTSLASNTLTLPVFTTQSVDTTVVLPDGGVAVIGGLIDEVELLKDHYSPIWGKFPLIGNLFKNKNNRTLKSHLVVFVKATAATATPIKD